MPDAIPRFVRVKDAIKRDIAAGTYRAGARMPAQAVLLRTFGVTQSTLTRAVHDLIREGVLETRHGSGTFVSRQAVRGRRIEIMIPDVINPFYPFFASSIAQCAKKHGLDADIHITTLGGEAALLRRLLAVPESVIVTRGLHSDLVKRIVNAELERFVFFNRIPGLPPHTDVFLTDFEDGGYRAVKHLIGHGHRRILFVGENIASGNARFDGYRRALSEHRIPFDESCVLSFSHRTGFQYHAEDKKGAFAARILACAKRSGATAVFAYSDYLAVYLLASCHAKHIAVPDDLSICGFDGVTTDITALFGLTTVRQPIAELAEKAFARLAQGDMHAGRVVTERPVLISGRTVADIRPGKKGARS